MDKKKLEILLTDLRDKKLSVDMAMDKLKDLPFEDIGVANIDHHRELRRGTPEVIFGQGKTPEDIIEIMKRMHKKECQKFDSRVAGMRVSYMRLSRLTEVRSSWIGKAED